MPDRNRAYIKEKLFGSHGQGTRALPEPLPNFIENRLYRPQAGFLNREKRIGDARYRKRPEPCSTVWIFKDPHRAQEWSSRCPAASTPRRPLRC